MRAQRLIAAGAGNNIVFKNCRDGIHTDVFETICAFLNEGGGTLLLGVNENGSVSGLSKRAVPEVIKGLARAVSNPDIFLPAAFIMPEEEILDGKHILVLDIPESPEVHGMRGQVFVRRGGQTLRLERREELARLYLRKQDMYTERKLYPFLRENDLRPELLSRIRALAQMQKSGHPWGDLSDHALLAEMNLSGVNYETGERGLRFLAALLCGKDYTIRNIFGNTEVFCEKRTDAQIQRLQLDTNLLDEAEKITGFLEDALGESAADFTSVFLTEREYTGAYPAKICVTEKEVIAEFAGSLGRCGNPLLRRLFCEMGLYHNGAEKKFKLQDENGICTLIADRQAEKKSKEAVKPAKAEKNREAEKVEDAEKAEKAVQLKQNDGVQETLPFVADVYASCEGRLTPGERQEKIMKMMAENERVSIGTMVRTLQVTKRTILRDIDRLKKQGLVLREGSEKSGRWLLCPVQGTEE